MPVPRRTQLQPAPRWKGKERDLAGRDEGDGAEDGVVIDLTLITDSPYQSTYVAPVFLGQALSKHFVQVDTGSSDLWLASTACSSSVCNAIGGERYDPSASQPTNQNIQINYAEGEASGPIVWDAVQLGGYSIDHQALIAASNVNSEPLSSGFDGVMGLALPGNSVIAHQLPTATNDVPDGASLSSNLFSITPIDTAPGARFFSLALERPGSDRVPSVLGIGRHPESLVPDPTKIEYAAVSPSSYALFWQASVSAITVYVDGQPKSVSLPASVVPAAKAPSAILDSGVPLIVTTTQIANGIYGAMGIGPASDGNYYVPCTTPLNVSLKLDSRSELFLHPLDLTAYPPNDASSETCVGIIQTPASIPGLSFGTTADVVLGVPFLRNAYLVMAYDPPFPNGTFPSNSVSADRVDSARPRVGLMGLTDPATAADEFHQVRVLRKPLGSAASPAPSHGKGLSAGIEVLIGLLGFFGLCFVLFAARWAYTRRRYRRERVFGGNGGNGGGGGGDQKDAAYVLSALGYKAPRRAGGEPSEDELRQRRFDAYRRRHMSQSQSQYTDDTAVTHGDGEYAPHAYDKDKDEDKDEHTGTDTGHWKRGSGPSPADEFGLLRVPPTPGGGGGGGGGGDYFDAWGDTLVASPASPDDLQTPLSALLPPPRSAHRRTFSGGPGADVPLLSSHGRRDSGQSVHLHHLRDSDIAEFGFGYGFGAEPEPELETTGMGMSMAGIGRRRFSSLGGSTLGSPRDEYAPSLSSPSLSPSPYARAPSYSGYSARTPSYSGYSAHARTGSGASGNLRESLMESLRERESTRESPIPVPMPAVAVERAASENVVDASLNNSRASVIGHES